MDEETGMRQHHLVNALINSKIYVPLSIKTDPEGNLVLNSSNDPPLVISGDLSKITYHGKSIAVEFDENKRPTEEMIKSLSVIKTEMRLAEKEEAPTVRASEIPLSRKKEPAVQEITPISPKLREMPKETNVAIAGSPIDRLSHEMQKEKGKAERIRIGNA
jgi:hypothetical protein